jgi:DNA-binding response OmpR family regulator
MKILIIEDEKNIAKFLKLSLGDRGHEIELSYDGEEAYKIALHNNFDMILLDLALPSKDGLSVLTDLRKNNINTPIILLSAEDKIKNKIEGLDLGADDYLPKPFSFDELNARINALLRRSNPSYLALLYHGELILDTIKHLAIVNDEEIKLTRKEYALLECLMKNKNEIVTRKEIANYIWAKEEGAESNIVDVYVKRLRTKLGKDSRGEQFVKSVRAIGYKLNSKL